MNLNQKVWKINGIGKSRCGEAKKLEFEIKGLENQ